MSEIKQRIVLADDDPVIRHILTSILESAGYEVLAAGSGTECLAILSRARDENAPPVACFLDMFLGDMSGLDVLKSIRSIFVDNCPPAIMLSANPKEEALSIDRSVTPEAYLEKPFTGKVVLATLAELLA